MAERSGLVFVRMLELCTQSGSEGSKVRSTVDGFARWRLEKRFERKSISLDRRMDLSDEAASNTSWGPLNTTLDSGVVELAGCCFVAVISSGDFTSGFVDEGFLGFAECDGVFRDVRFVGG